MAQKNLMIIAVVAVVIVVAAAAFVLLNNGSGDNKFDYETDFAGKPIEVADNLDDGIVAVGQDSFRWMTYFGLADKCVMVDMNDMTNYLGKSFMYNGRALVDIVMKTLAPELDGDILHYKATNTMKLIYWKSRDSS